MKAFITDRPFPDDVWSDAGITDHARAMSEARSALAEAGHWFGASRSDDVLTDFVAGLPDGDVFLFGAGTHTERLLDRLRVRRGIRIRGIVDRLADFMDGAFGYEVITPAALADRAFDYVLLSHTAYEAEMTEALIAQGVPADRIVPIYANPAFATLARTVPAQAAAALGGRRADFVVISNSAGRIVSDRRLAEVLPPDRTVEIYFGRTGEAGDPGPFERVCAMESLDVLGALLGALRPRAIYLRGIIYKAFLGSWILERFPGLRLIQELYDYAVLWPDDDLDALFGMTPRTIRTARLLEYHAAQRASLTLSKRGGPEWERVLRRCGSPYRLYFPLVEPNDHLPAAWRQEDGPLRLLYAGFLPTAAFLGRFTNAHNFIPVMQAVCGDNRARADIYNSVHLGPMHDRLFSAHIDSLRDGPVRYHRRIPAADLFDRMGGYDLGWLADAQHRFQPDRYVAVCNRWAGYVAGGLPTLLDAGWTFMADLVRRFNAGIVVDSLDPEHIAARLRTADLPALRRGAAELRRDVLGQNEASLETLAATILEPALQPERL